MKYSIECFGVAIFGLVSMIFFFYRIRPYIEKKEEDEKKKWFMIIKIIIIIGCIGSMYLTALGFYFLIKYGNYA